MRKWIWAVAIFCCIGLGGAASAAESTASTYEYTSPEGIRFTSDTPMWDTQQLKELYELLLQAGHSSELAELKSVELHQDKSVGNSGFRVGKYDPERKSISLYEVERIPVRRTLIHEYGHHFTYYWLKKKEGVTPPRVTSTSEWAKVRQLDGYPVRFAGEKMPYNHRWDPGEIMAEDYVMLFGPSAMEQPETNRDIVGMLRHENEYIPPVTDKPEMLKYWTSVAKMDDYADIRTPEVTDFMKEKSEEDASQSLYRIQFSSAAVTEHQEIDYSVKVAVFTKEDIFPQRSFYETSTSSKEPITLTVDLADMPPLDKVAFVNLQVWAYDKAGKRLAYTPFYDHWYQLEDKKPKPSAPPFEQQGISSMLQRDGMKKWPLVRLYYNGHGVNPQRKVYQRDGGIYVPVSYLTQQLGASMETVKAADQDKEYQIKLPSNKVDLLLDTDAFTLNGGKGKLKKKIRMEEQEPVISIEDASALLPIKTTWFEQSGTLIIENRSGGDSAAEP
ncbi:stalk domain-containing protein [Paenibacillus thalictri]|nr:stalk domain-containing protein [Paenibacillus thalictri]